jgi:hypothetical protein
MMTYGRVDIYTHVYVTSTLIGGEWSTTLCSLGKSPLLSGLQYLFRRRGKENNFARTGTRIRLLGRPARSQSLSWDVAVNSHPGGWRERSRHADDTIRHVKLIPWLTASDKCYNCRFVTFPTRYTDARTE